MGRYWKSTSKASVLLSCPIPGHLAGVVPCPICEVHRPLCPGDRAGVVLWAHLQCNQSCALHGPWPRNHRAVARGGHLCLPWMADWRCQGLRCWDAELTATSALLRGCAPALRMGMAWQESVGAGHLPVLVSICRTRVLITERPLQSAEVEHVKAGWKKLYNSWKQNTTFSEQDLNEVHGHRANHNKPSHRLSAH